MMSKKKKSEKKLILPIYVTCPGVWLCPKGKILLKLTCFGIERRTKKIFPKFPLNFNEILTFEKIVVGGINSIINVLEYENVCIELIQWTSYQSKLGVILAKFTERIITFFEPFILSKNVSHSSDVDILVNRTDYFPGIISPKVRCKLHLKIKPYERKQMFMNHASVNNLCRQRSVCHSDSNPSFTCFCDPRTSFNCSTCRINKNMDENWIYVSANLQIQKFGTEYSV
ncbi:hypothetical protein PGB90_005604 [Kerria lacca]